jgi:hypothetical protein
VVARECGVSCELLQLWMSSRSPRRESSLRLLACRCCAAFVGDPPGCAPIRAGCREQTRREQVQGALGIMVIVLESDQLFTTSAGSARNRQRRSCRRSSKRGTGAMISGIRGIGSSTGKCFPDGGRRPHRSCPRGYDGSQSITLPALLYSRPRPSFRSTPHEHTKHCIPWHDLIPSQPHACKLSHVWSDSFNR